MNTAVSTPLCFHSDESRNKFDYQALDIATDSFRLLKVLPARSVGNLLQLSLWHDSVSSASYRCLSYRWGDQSKLQTILIDGKTFSIRENLHHFLEEMHKWTTREEFHEALWIDSICIDQENVHERGHQVQRMGDIYAGALEVFIWLGKCTVSDTLGTWLRSEQLEERPIAYREQWDNIRLNAYWYRAWIVQEILLASNVTVVLPDVRVDWQKFGRKISLSGDLASLEEESAASLWAFWKERWTVQPSFHIDTFDGENRSSQDTFWNLLVMVREAQCTDNRDRIYSVLGLVHGGGSFPVDYNETTPDLFWRAGEHFDAWCGPDHVDILRCALFRRPNHDNDADTSNRMASDKVSPWLLARSLRNRPAMHIRIPVRRWWKANRFDRWMHRVKCNFKHCDYAPYLHCARDDVLFCTNISSNDPTEHGCIHGVAYPLDKPAAEPFEIRYTAHHGGASTIRRKGEPKTVRGTLPSTALQVFDHGTNQWFGVLTWSSLQKALNTKSLDRIDHVKIRLPAKLAMWIWFGVHPDHIENEYAEDYMGLPSAHNLFPPGTRVTQNTLEIPSPSDTMTREPRVFQGVLE